MYVYVFAFTITMDKHHLDFRTYNGGLGRHWFVPSNICKGEPIKYYGIYNIVTGDRHLINYILRNKYVY